MIPASQIIFRCTTKSLNTCVSDSLTHFYLLEYDPFFLQMVVILKKLTYGALISPSLASEEFREGIIKCFRALLLNLSPCSDSSCSCKQITGLPALLVGDDMLTHPVRRSRQNLGGECLLAFLQTQTASAAIGHWLSLLHEVCKVLSGTSLLHFKQIHMELILVFMQRLQIWRLRAGIEEVQSFE